MLVAHVVTILTCWQQMRDNSSRNNRPRSPINFVSLLMLCAGVFYCFEVALTISRHSIGLHLAEPLLRLGALSAICHCVDRESEPKTLPLNRYCWLIGYLLAELLSNISMREVRPHHWNARIDNGAADMSAIFEAVSACNYCAATFNSFLVPRS